MKPREQLVTPNLHHRILGIMKELDYVAKGDKTVNGQYRFVSHDAVTAKLHPLLVKYGVTIIPNMESMTQEGNRTTVSIRFTFVNADCPADNFTVQYFAQGIDPGDKGPGKAISYAYKYALLKTFCLETGDDPDNDAKAAYEPPKCQEFSTMIPAEYTQKDMHKVEKFLEERSKALGRHVEDIKREAIKRMPEFLEAVKKWNPKQKEEK